MKLLSQLSLSTLAILALLVVATDAIPEHTPLPPSCSCAGKPGCETVTFATGAFGKSRAYCALYQGGQSCCLVVPAEKEH